MGIYLTAPAFGRVLVLSITNSVLMPLFNSNWRLTLLVYALVAFLITFIWIILSKENDCDLNDIESKNLFKSMKTFPELISIGQVRMILFIVLGMFLFNHGTNNWIPEILIDLGINSLKLLTNNPICDSSCIWGIGIYCFATIYKKTKLPNCFTHLFFCCWIVNSGGFIF